MGLRLSPTMATDTDLDTTAATGPTDTTARGRLRLHPRLWLSPRPRLSPTMATATDLDTTADTVDTVILAATGPTDSTARGRLKLHPRLRLSPTMAMATDLDTTAADTSVDTTVLATGDTPGDKLL